MPMLIVTSRYLKKGAVKKIAELCEVHCNPRRLCACKRKSGNEPQEMKKKPISSVFNFVRNQQNRLANFVK